MKFDEGSNERGWTYYSRSVNRLALYSYFCIIYTTIFIALHKLFIIKHSHCLVQIMIYFDFNFKNHIVYIMYSGLFSPFFFALQYFQRISSCLEFTQTPRQILVPSLINKLFKNVLNLSTYNEGEN